MPLSIGSRLGPYEITGPLGAGGMGEVYRAADTRLSRDVAIKIIPESFAADPDRMARFTREAQVLASLNHPNIAAIYGVEERAIVMELVEGETLAGPLPADEAIPIARQIADALEYAHEKGFIHRDLKPANIKVTPQGRVKVLDFGLAKAFSTETGSASSPHNSPTLTMHATIAGMIVGTAAYMSPEQAKGKPVDRRGDIWSFGVVLWELLTGRQMFGGMTASETLASVIKDAPPLDAMPPATPIGVRRLIARCLEKDPQRRLRDIGEARIALEDAGAGSAAAPTVEVRRGRWPYVAAACGIAAVLAAAGWWRATRPVVRPLLNVTVDLGHGSQTGARSSFAVSPDGARLVYFYAAAGALPSLAIRELNQPQGKVLAGTEGAVLPFFSTDGQWIGFFANQRLKKIPIAGGTVMTLCDTPGNGRGADWGEDGGIVFASGAASGLFRVSESGGNAEPLTTLESGEASHRWPQRLPGGDALIFTANSSLINWDGANIVVYSLKTRQRKTLVRGGYYGRYVPGGYLVYVRESQLFGVRFDADKLETSGQPAVLVADIAANDVNSGGQYDFARNGLFLYLAVKPGESEMLYGWMAAGGKVHPLRGVTLGAYRNPRLSPDGKRLALSTATRSISIWDFERETLTHLRNDTLNPYHPVWTPDGRHLIYASRSPLGAIWWQRADGGGEPLKLIQGNSADLPSSISPDGRFLAYTLQGQGWANISIVPIDASDPEHPKAGTPEPFLNTPAEERYPQFSPDGRWLAYTSSESGTREVYVQPFRGGAGRWHVSAGGGDKAKWSRVGRQLFFEGPDNRVMVVDYSVSGNAFSAGKPRQWSDTPINDAGGLPNFDVAPDGNRILAFPATEHEPSRPNVHATFLINFFDEVKRRIP